MPTSSALTALSVAVFGAGAAPTFSLASLTSASVYLAFLAMLKSFILFSPVTLFINAPFGRFASHTSAFRLPGRLSFMLMELPSPVLFALSLATPTALSHDVRSKSTYDLLHQLINPSLAHVKSLPAANLVLAALFIVHYANRSVVQSVRGPPRSPSHVSVVLSAIVFNVANGFIMGAWIGGRSPSLLVPSSLLSGKAAQKSIKSASWFAGILPRSNAASPGVGAVLPVAQAGLLPQGFAALLHPLFVIGVLGWAIGFASNVYHDEILFNLRRPDKRGGGPAEGTRTNTNKALVNGAPAASNGEVKSDATKPRYEIPHGGLYEWISYPNYLSEWLEWSFYALAALSQTTLSPLQSNALPLTTSGRLALLLSVPPVVFVVVEIAVMLPRALSGHSWYHGKFGVEGDNHGGRYPLQRKAVIPFVL